jgi:hypothetical protein
MAIPFTTRIIFLRRTAMGNCCIYIQKMGRTTEPEQKNLQGGWLLFLGSNLYIKRRLGKGFLVDASGIRRGALLS